VNDAQAVVTLNLSSVSGDSAGSSGNGGGIENHGTATIYRSILSNNSSIGGSGCCVAVGAIKPAVQYGPDDNQQLHHPSQLGWLILGFFFSIITLIVLLLLPSKRTTNAR